MRKTRVQGSNKKSGQQTTVFAETTDQSKLTGKTKKETEEDNQSSSSGQSEDGKVRKRYKNKQRWNEK